MMTDLTDPSGRATESVRGEMTTGIADLPYRTQVQWDHISQRIDEIPLAELQAMPDYPRTVEAGWALWVAMPAEKRLHEYGDHNRIQPGQRFDCMVGGYSYGASSDIAESISAYGETMQEAIYRAHLKLEALKKLTTGV